MSGDSNLEGTKLHGELEAGCARKAYSKPFGTTDCETMNENEAIEVANDHVVKLGGALADYRNPTARLVGGEWLVLYEEHSRQVGAHVIVAVDNITGETSSSAGA